MMRNDGRTGIFLGLLLAASPAWATMTVKDQAGLLQAMVGDPCVEAGLQPAAGGRFEWTLRDSPELQGRFYAVIKAGDRRVLLDLRRDEDGWQVLERRAWVLRNGQRRLLKAPAAIDADADLAELPPAVAGAVKAVRSRDACATRVGAPAELLDAVQERAEREGRWERARWPKKALAAKKAAKAKADAKKKDAPKASGAGH